MKIYVKKSDLAPSYNFDGNVFSNIRINEKGGGVISIYGQTTETLITATFNNITAYNIKSAPGIKGLEGGVVFA